jgi:hypothetical protein
MHQSIALRFLAGFGRLLLSMVLLAATWFTWTEWNAARQLKGLVRSAQGTGSPVDDQSMQTWFEQKTNKEKTQAWSEILALSASRAIRERVTNLADETADEVVPDSNDPKALDDYFRGVGKTIEELQPLLDRIHSESHVEQPVWIPIRFDGMNTLLECLSNSVHVRRLLVMEWEYAMHAQDRDRALASLQAMHRCLKVFDWPLGTIATSFHAGRRVDIYNQIERSLRVLRWNEQQLVALQSLLTPMDLETTWRNMLEANQALLKREFSADDYRASAEERLALRFISLPSWQLARWEDNIKARDAVGAEYEQLSVIGEKLEREMLPARFGVSWKQFADMLASHESYRRFVLAATEVQLFQSKNGRLPKDLSELSEVKSQHSVYRSVNGKPFEFQWLSAGKQAKLVSKLSDGKFSDAGAERDQFVLQIMSPNGNALQREMLFEATPGSDADPAK